MVRQLDTNLIVRKGLTSRVLGGEACHCLPRLEALGHLLTVHCGSQPVPTGTEVRANDAMDGKKALCLGRRFEAAHPPLPLARGLVGVLGAVIAPLVLAMFDPRQELGFRGTVALQLIGDQNPRNILQALEQLTEKPLGSEFIPVRLHQNAKTPPA